MTAISLVGLGNMGFALGESLLSQGLDVTVWNRSESKAAPLVAKGARLADSLQDAVLASPGTMFCVKNHQTTLQILEPVMGSLNGRTILDLSTGGVKEAEDLVQRLQQENAKWLIGSISGYPWGIGKEFTSILCGAEPNTWEEWKDIIMQLGGASQLIGSSAQSVPALFAAMFTARQGFKFGLMFGGALCLRAGIPMQAFVDQLPVTFTMLEQYAQNFTDTVVGKNYDNAQATVDAHVDSYTDIVSTFDSTGTQADLPRMMVDLAKAASAKGWGTREITVLVEYLANNSN